MDLSNGLMRILRVLTDPQLIKDKINTYKVGSMENSLILVRSKPLQEVLLQTRQLVVKLLVEGVQTRLKLMIVVVEPLVAVVGVMPTG